MRTRTAAEWEVFLQARHVPAARVRTMGEAVADPQFKSRGIIYRHAAGHGVDGAFGVRLRLLPLRTVARASMRRHPRLASTP